MPTEPHKVTPLNSSPRIGICKTHGWYFPLDPRDLEICPEPDCLGVIDVYIYETTYVPDEEAVA